MLETQQMFLFLFKSKYRRKCEFTAVLCVILVMCGFVSVINSLSIRDKCVDSPSCNNNGVCRNETCICNDGWQGNFCQHCGGKVR